MTDEYKPLLCTARENLLKEANKTASNMSAGAMSNVDGSSSMVILIFLLDLCNSNNFHWFTLRFILVTF